MDDRVPAAELLAGLAATPERLQAAALRAGAGARRAPAPGAWSVADTLTHVRASAAIITPRLHQAVIRPGVVWPAFDERAWSALAERSAPPLDVQLRTFALTRAELLLMLRSLTDAEWLRTGEHEEYGSLTVAHVVHAVAAHEAAHCDQADAAADAAVVTRPA
jgi:hypothetical protein